MLTVKKIVPSIFILITLLTGCDPQDKSTTNDDNGQKKTKTVIEIPDNKEECLAKGGTWKAMGIFPAEICDIPTSDGGKPCTSSNECEGSCLAVNISDKDRRDLMSGKKKNIPAEGRCTDTLRVFGCVGFVENGVIDQYICLD